MKQQNLTVEVLRDILSYNHETGDLFWKHRSDDFFESTTRSAKGQASNWNANNANKKALNNIDRDGYFRGSIFSKNYRAHRIVWAIHYGTIPDKFIDHINGIKTDNRISNLRLVNNQENSKNQAKRQKNTSGYIGVTWHKKAKKWIAQITIDYKNVYLGIFESKNDAITARLKAEKKFNFHENHGKR